MTMITNPFIFESLVSARYWRIRTLDNQSLGSTAAASSAGIEMRSLIGGTNIATGGTASASNSNSGAASNAFDGNPTTNWITGNFSYGTHWIAYDFGSPVSVVEIVYSKRSDSFGPNEAPLYGDVQYSSDNTNWFTSWPFFSSTLWTGSGTQTQTFNRLSGLPINRNWRIIVDKTAYSEFITVNNASIAEIEMRLTPGGADQCSGGDAFSPSGTPANAFDNNSSNIWNPSGSLPFPLQYRFTSQKDIVEIAITGRNDFFIGDGPTEFRIATADGPLSVIKTIKTGPWGPGETRLFDVNGHIDAPKKFIRLRPTGVHGGSGARFSCTKVEFRTSFGGSDIATGGTAFARDYSDTNFPANAFDSTLSTRYAARLVGDYPNNYIGYHLNSEIADTVVQVALTATNETFGPSEAPTGFHVEYGVGNNWTNIWTESGITSWTAGQTKIFTKP